MMAHYVAQRRDAAVMHVRRRERDIAQPRYAKLAAVLRLRLERARGDRARALAIVVITTEQGVRVLPQTRGGLHATAAASGKRNRMADAANWPFHAKRRAAP